MSSSFSYDFYYYYRDKKRFSVFVGSPEFHFMDDNGVLTSEESEFDSFEWLRDQVSTILIGTNKNPEILLNSTMPSEV